MRRITPLSTGVCLLLGLLPPATGGAATTNFYPVADCSVKDDHPSTNYAAEDTLYIDTSPDEMHMYLRFDLSGITGPVTSATLRLYCINSGNAGEIHTSSTTVWDETTPTWYSPLPADGPYVGRIECPFIVGEDTWRDADVTSAVTGDGPVTFVVTPTGSDGVDYRSREHTRAPYLVVVWEDWIAPTCSVSADSTLVCTGDTVGFTASSSDPDGGAILFHEWDFSYDGATFWSEASGATTSRSFSLPGVYTVAVRATDDEYQTCIDTVDVDVVSPPDETPEIPDPGPDGWEPPPETSEGWEPSPDGATDTLDAWDAGLDPWADIPPDNPWSDVSYDTGPETLPEFDGTVDADVHADGLTDTTAADVPGETVIPYDPLADDGSCACAPAN